MTEGVTREEQYEEHRQLRLHVIQCLKLAKAGKPEHLEMILKKLEQDVPKLASMLDKVSADPDARRLLEAELKHTEWLISEAKKQAPQTRSHLH